MATTKKEHIIDVKLLSRVMRFVKPYKVVFLISIFFSISLGVLSISRPIIIEYTVDHFIIGADPEMLLKYTIIMIGLLLLESIVKLIFFAGLYMVSYIPSL